MCVAWWKLKKIISKIFFAANKLITLLVSFAFQLLYDKHCKSIVFGFNATQKTKIVIFAEFWRSWSLLLGFCFFCCTTTAGKSFAFCCKNAECLTNFFVFKCLSCNKKLWLWPKYLRCIFAFKCQFFSALFWLYLPNDSFSPESGGSVKPNKAIDAISTHGIIKLKK